MGMCYSVETNLVFRDVGLFCDIIKEEYEKRELITSYKPDDFSDPYECFKALCPNSHYIDNGEWYADFDASYGWESVLLEIFEETLIALDKGSQIDIYPDDAHHILKVKNDGTYSIKHYGIL